MISAFDLISAIDTISPLEGLEVQLNKQLCKASPSLLMENPLRVAWCAALWSGWCNVFLVPLLLHLSSQTRPVHLCLCITPPAGACGRHRCALPWWLGDDVLVCQQEGGGRGGRGWWSMGQASEPESEQGNTVQPLALCQWLALPASQKAGGGGSCSRRGGKGFATPPDDAAVVALT